MSFTSREKRGTAPSRKFVPKPYQLESIRFGVSRPAAGFFLAPGLGKTMVALSVFRILRRMGLVDELLVVAKRRIVYETWPPEIAKWEETSGLRVKILHGTKKSASITAQKVDVWLINFDGLAWLKNQKTWLRRGKRVMLVIDESSKLRHTNTQRFRAFRKLAPFFSRRYIMTGTPTPKGIMGLFGQVFALDLGATLGKYVTHFRNEYFEPTGYQGREWAVQEGGERRIFKKLRPLIIRFGDDQLDLPPITPLHRYIELPSKVRKLYDTMERELIVQVRKGFVTAANAAVASAKLRQIANGALYHNDRREGHTDLHYEKAEDLVELLDELQGEPALIAYEHLFEHERLKRYFKKHAPQYKDAVYVSGKMKDRELTAIRKAWDRGDIPALFGNSTIAYGLNMQGKGGIVVYYALTWNTEDYEQFYRRVWRQGQERRVLVYHILARNTVDEDMWSVVQSDTRNQNRVLKAMEKRHGVR